MAQDEVKGRVEGVVKGYRIVKKRYYSDQGVEMDVEVPLAGIAQAVTGPSEGPRPPIPPGRAAAAPPGLVIDARGLGLQPALAPRLLDESGKVLYSAESLSEAARKESAPARYFKTLEQASKAPTAGDQPAADQGRQGQGVGPGPRGRRGAPAAGPAAGGAGRGPGGDRPVSGRSTRTGVVLLALLALSAPSRADKVPPVVTQDAEGEAAIVGGNVDRAAREAKEAALRSAVEQVAGVLISSQSLAVNSQLVSDQVYSHSAGYVQSYEVLSQSTERNVVKVKVRAKVGTAALDRDLQAVQALVRRLQGRKLVILLQEATIDDKGVATSSGVTSTVLTDAFKRDGWTMIDPSFAAGKVKVASAVAAGGHRGQGDRHPEQGRLHPLRDGGLPRRPARRGGGQVQTSRAPPSPSPGTTTSGCSRPRPGASWRRSRASCVSAMNDVSVNSRQESASTLVRAHQNGDHRGGPQGGGGVAARLGAERSPHRGRGAGRGRLHHPPGLSPAALRCGARRSARPARRR